MKALYKNPIAIILIVIAIAAFVYFEQEFPPIDLSDLDPGNVIAMLGYISVIMLIVEQFIEIFVDDPSEKAKKKCKDRIADIEAYMDEVNTPVDPMMIDPEEPMAEEETLAVDDKMIAMIKEKDRLEQQLMSHGLKRERRTTIVAFAIGLVLSFSGLRLMSGIIFNNPETEEQLFKIQVTIIQSIDIVLTAGIIAGGSGRMHRLIKRIKTTIGSEDRY
ncbi:hypothetical protein D1816_15460 [Aquimarina sp. AD10]|uniref:hypothetical protein n=1 Tax=Aquimarina TaxID=290174 RepID=UPI000E473BA3|nr:MULTISPECIES: hypothetical protein [Aquimarina]AXT61693.1 hypothetical protein D1816_15460 [Aquimarina sp. AD10]RKN00958.1 hypothetical protein D7033_06305 [Aquimarina sp. AD10]